jgi:hypothetical protein
MMDANDTARDLARAYVALVTDAVGKVGNLPAAEIADALLEHAVASLVALHGPEHTAERLRAVALKVEADEHTPARH